MNEFLSYIYTIIDFIFNIAQSIIPQMDSLDYVLIGCVVLDYISGVLNAIIEHRLSSKIGAKGICRKIFIFIIVGIGFLFDTVVLKQGKVLQSIITLFYICNESISILENAAQSGLPVPDILKKIIQGIEDEQNSPSWKRK